MNTIAEESASVVSGNGKKKKGLKKLGSSIKNAFGGKKRRRRRRKNGQDDESYASYDHSETGDSSIYSYQDGSSDGSWESSSDHQKRWIQGGNRHNGMSLTKITELENEDGSSIEGDKSSRRKSSNRYFPGRSSHDESSQRKNGRRSRKNKKHVPADPLSLVVLLVDPSSLRFELLSLDFDLEGSTTLRRKEDAVPELTLKVQDVLDQITPDSITDEKLRNAFGKGCKGLIDRSGQIHFGTASLETACACRALRPIDKAMNLRSKSRNSRSGDVVSSKETTAKFLLSVPTYSGDPHRDVLLSFFGEPNSNPKAAAKQDVSKLASQVSRSMELAKPIFADSNVVGLLEQNGFDLSGWKPGTSVPNHDEDIRSKRLSESPSITSKAMLLPPPKVERKVKWNADHPLVKMVLCVIAMGLATTLALAIVSGGLAAIPGIAISSSDNTEGPQTFEGYLMLGMNTILNWYSTVLSQSEIKK